MLKAKKLTILGLILSALGFIVPIVWDMWSKPHELSLVISSRTLLIQKLEGIDGLKVTLQEREIDKLFSTEISVENTGWKLISKDDIIKPMVVTFSDAPILGVALKERFPENLEYSVRLINQAEMEVEFDVLNRGEKLVLNILTDKEPKNIIGRVRAKNFSKLNVLDHHVDPPVARKIPTNVFFIIGFSIFYIIFGFYFGRKELGPLRRDTYFVERLEVGFDKDKLMNFLQRNIWFKLTEKQKERLTEHIERVDPADESSTRKLALEIAYEARNRDPSGVLVLTVVLAFGAFLYGCVQLIAAL